MQLRGLLAPALIFAGLVVACSADDGTVVVTVPSSSSSSSGYSSGTSGRGSSGYSTSGSSGIYDGPYGGTSGYPSTSGSTGTVPTPTIDLASILTIKASYDVCGKAPGACYDAESFTVDFQKSSLIDTTCIELAGSGDAGAPGKTQDVDATKAIDAKELDTVKARITAITKSSTGFEGYDGPIKVLEITTKTGTVLYSPEAGCGDTSKFTRIDSQSWNDLWDTLRAL